MIITLVKADFSVNNIGTLGSFAILTNLGNGCSYEGPTSVTKNSSFSGVINVNDNYTIVQDSVIVTMGGVTITDGITVSENKLEIAITSVTGTIIINCPTENKETGDISTNITGTLVANYAINISNELYADANFFTYTNIPVTAGNTYGLELARNIIFVNDDNNYVGHLHGWNTTTSAEGGVATIAANRPHLCTVIAPEGATKMHYCAKYADVADPTQSIIRTAKEDGSICVDEALIMSGAETNTANNSTVTTKDVYFTLFDYPVTAGKTYNTPNGRNWLLTDDAGTQVTYGPATNTVTVPDGATKLHMSFKYTDVTPDTLVITEA